MKPPRSVQLPGGRVVRLRLNADVHARKPSGASSLFSGACELFASDVELVDGDAPMDPGKLSLREFHALRAIATHLGWLEEDEVEVECRNCGHVLRVCPCAAMNIGPFVDEELDDEELDTALDLDAAHEVPELGEGFEVRLRAVTVDEAAPLHRALAAGRFEVTPEIVTAMGVIAMGEKQGPRAMARILRRCDDRAFGAMTNLFLAAHYSPRLFGLAVCEHCGARNDVDAPYDREFDFFEEAQSELAPFPSLDEFDELARGIAAPLLERAAGERLTFVVEGGTPACDDGGEPLLGSYVPGSEGDAQTPACPGEVTVYYRTFAAMWNEDGPYDIEAELRDTIEHEIEHHESNLVGHDPKDEEERDEIAREARRVIGRKAIARASANALALEVRDFWKRTWLVWFIALIAVVIAAIASK